LRKDLDAFFKATERWHLTSTERRTLLGVSFKERWLRCLHDAAPQLSPQELVRVRAVSNRNRIRRSRVRALKHSTVR
jgi:hypothetical protein